MEFFAEKHFFSFNMSLLPNSLGAKLAFAKESELEFTVQILLNFFYLINDQRF